MYQDFEEGNRFSKPDVQSFATVLDAWARKGTVEAADRCEKILRRMKKLSKEGTLPVKPNAVSYSSVINAHAKSGQPEKAEEWLKAMFDDYEQGNSSARPHVHSFGAVLDAWARHGTEESAKKCEAILNHMKMLSDKGILPVRPNAIVYSCVINAWANLGDPKKARLVFDDMIADYNNGNRTVKPGTASYGTLLKAIRESGSGDSAGEMADSLLQEMEELRIRPDLSAFVLVIQCWEQSLQSGHPNANQRIQALQEIRDGMRAKGL